MDDRVGLGVLTVRMGIDFCSRPQSFRSTERVAVGQLLVSNSKFGWGQFNRFLTFVRNDKVVVGGLAVRIVPVASIATLVIPKH